MINGVEGFTNEMIFGYQTQKISSTNFKIAGMFFLKSILVGY